MHYEKIDLEDKALKIIDTTIDRISDVLAFIAGILLVYIVVTITIDVIARYFFNNPLPYTLDISEILLHFITFLTAAWVMKRDGHVRMDFVLALLPEKQQQLLLFISSIVSSIICIILCWYGGVVTWDLYSERIIQGVMLELPKAPIIAVIPLSFLVLFLQCVKKTALYFKTWKTL